MELLISWTIVVLMLFIVLAFNGLCLQYVLNYWLSFIQKKTILVPFFVTFIGALFIPAVIEATPLALAVLTWVISFGIENPYYR